MSDELHVSRVAPSYLPIFQSREKDHPICSRTEVEWVDRAFDRLGFPNLHSVDVKFVYLQLRRLGHAKYDSLSGSMAYNGIIRRQASSDSIKALVGGNYESY